MWADIKAIEQRIGDGLEKPNVRRLAKHIHEYTCGYVPLKKIERSVGYHADSESVKEWIARLLAGDDGSFEWAVEHLDSPRTPGT